VIFLFGERTHSQSGAAGEQLCGVCGKRQPFSHVIETNYFCLFGMRLLPIERTSDYLRCDQCNNSFLVDQLEEPTQVAVVKRILVYIQLGYGMQEHGDLLQDICVKVTGFEFKESEIEREMREIGSGRVDIFELLKSLTSGLNLKAKQQIIETAFLITHACCEIQYEDRLRINLVGNALGIPIEFVTSIINQVHSQGCYGVRRLLSTQTKAT